MRRPLALALAALLAAPLLAACDTRDRRPCASGAVPMPAPVVPAPRPAPVMPARPPAPRPAPAPAPRTGSGSSNYYAPPPVFIPFFGGSSC